MVTDETGKIQATSTLPLPQSLMSRAMGDLVSRGVTLGMDRPKVGGRGTFSCETLEGVIRDQTTR